MTLTLNQNYPGIYACSPEDGLDAIFDPIRKSRVHRWVVVDEQNHLNLRLSGPSSWRSLTNTSTVPLSTRVYPNSLETALPVLFTTHADILLPTRISPGSCACIVVDKVRSALRGEALLPPTRKVINIRMGVSQDLLSKLRGMSTHLLSFLDLALAAQYESKLVHAQ